MAPTKKFTTEVVAKISSPTAMADYLRLVGICNVKPTGVQQRVATGQERNETRATNAVACQVRPPGDWSPLIGETDMRRLKRCPIV